MKDAWRISLRPYKQSDSPSDEQRAGCCCKHAENKIGSSSLLMKLNLFNLQNLIEFGAALQN
ncbi:unnamed protein product [Gongylonema pulchrum]|uniref:Uncharacterized protein n=1 Tax=Gongylonema pulchrum TaxID=637853 RepID=A0A183D4G0_9BILA|nr:unnamed protein product [Gongylonema pulchrum]